MATIDDKVVAMSFESSKFEQGVSRTISALEKLKAALKFDGAGKGLQDIDAAAKKVDLSHISSGVTGIMKALDSLRLIAIGVFAQLTTQAVRFAGNIVKAFTLDPIKQGFAEYSTNLNAIQTILANTQAAGTNLQDVNKALQELNDYSDRTIYNFSQMAKNIGTFTAAGVQLDVATGAIKGIANLAALSGSNSEQAATAMYQLSQAISAGSVKLMDWNSVVNAGMGGTVFQRALANTAVAMGTLSEKAVKLTGPMKNVTIEGEAFRNSLSRPGKDSWLTSKVLTTTLKQFTGDLSDAELAAQGFNAAQIKAIQQTAQTAMHAATEVKTISQVFEVAKETAGSGWAKTFQIIFGNFTEAKKTFTALSETINGFINTNADARNKILSDWKKLGGRTLLIDSIRIAFHNLGMIIKPIKQAFRDIFPAVTGKRLFELTQRFNEFAKSLKPSEETINNLRRTFRGLFAIFSIGGQIISGIFTMFGRLFGSVSEGSGSFLNFTGNIGDFLVSLDQALKKGDKLNNFFEKLGDVLSAPIDLIKALAEALADLFSGFSFGGFSDQIDGATKALTPFQRVLEMVSNVWTAFIDAVSGSGEALRPALDAVVQAIIQIPSAIGHAFANMNFEAILAVIRTGLFAGLVLMIKQFLGRGSFAKQLSGLGGGIFQNIAGSFQALQGSMVALQNNIRAKTLKEIAIAIALLTASVVALSFVDPERLKSALAAMAVGFGELLGAMAILEKISKGVGFAKLPIIAAGLIGLGIAIDVLTIAVFALSKLSWEELLKGLGGVAVLLGLISAAAIPLSANSAGLIRAGVGITAVAVALLLLSMAVRSFSGMSWTELGKGLISIAIGLGIMAGAMRVMPPNMVLTGAGLIAVAVGLKILASAVRDFGNMDLKTTGKGMLGIAGALVIIAGAMRLMPGNMIITAAGLLIVSFALGKIVDAVASMGGMSISTIAKGLIGLGAALVILAGALYLMSGTLAGAAALTIAAAGIALLVPALATLGGLSWGTIIKGLVALGLAFAVIGAAGVLITGAVPGLLGFGAAMVLIGAGLALAGAGIFLITTAFSALVVALPTGVGVIIAALIELQRGLIENAKLLILGLLEVLRAFAATAPKFMTAVVKILSTVIDGIIQLTPKLIELAGTLIDALITVLDNNQDKIIQAGMNLLLALLEGIRNNIGDIVDVVVDIVVEFLNALAKNISKIVTAGWNVLKAIIKGITSHITNVITVVGTIITTFIRAISNNLGRIVRAGADLIVRFITGITNSLGRIIAAGTNLIVKFITGIGNAGPRIVTAATNAMIKFINALQKNSNRLVEAGFKAVIKFLNGVADSIEAHEGEMLAAGFRIGKAIVQGMINGLGSLAGSLYDKAKGIFNKAKDIATHPWRAFSPSRVMYDLGQNIIQGMILGLGASEQDLYRTTATLSNGVIDTFNTIFQTKSPSRVMFKIGGFVGQGFADGLKGVQPIIENALVTGIRDAFTNLNTMIQDEMRAAKDKIKETQDSLKELREADKKDVKAIEEAEKALKKNVAALKELTAVRNFATESLKDERAELIKLANKYQDYTDKLEEAQTKLEELKQTRDDEVASLTGQYNALPDFRTKDEKTGASIDAVGEYLKALQFQTNAVANYRTTLDQLRKMGLDDATYQKLLAEGVGGQEFASALLKGGKTAVESVNELDKNLLKESTKLAENAGRNLYDVGIAAAQGVIDGLKSKQTDVKNAMEELADQMVKALKKKLKIKSPSEVFAELGKFSMEGMAKGFSDSSKILTDAIDDAGKQALTKMQQTVRDISNVVSEELNPNPVITPILDLTQVRSQAGNLAALTRISPLTTTAQASLISTEQVGVEGELTAVAPGGTHVKFEQNNYSPEALTPIEIYRQTRNQLSQLKSVLAT